MATADLDPHGVNILYGYADSNFATPRSTGCSITMLNGCPVAIRVKKHTTTDDSTMKAEITEAFHASSDIVALRNLMAEIGLYQEEPTVLYQDNKPAIQVAENKGALNKSSRALDIRVFTLRNRIALKWKDTLSLAEGIGTKLFSIKRFKFLRDLVNGYALARAKGKVALPSMVIKLK